MLLFAAHVFAQAPHGSLNNETTIAAGTGAIARSAETKARETVNANDFGADASGTNDSAASINAAISQVKILGGTVMLTAGTYRVNAVPIALASGVILSGSGPSTVINGTGAFAPISAINTTNAGLQNLTVKSVNDSILIKSSGAANLWTSVSNVAVTSIGNGHAGIRIIGGAGSGDCGFSGNCVYYPSFYNVTVDGGTAAPNVGTRIGLSMTGDAVGSIRPLFVGGSIRNVETAVSASAYSSFYMYGTAVDGICTVSPCGPTGNGVGFYLNGQYAQVADVSVRFESGGVDNFWNIPAGSPNGAYWTTIAAPGISGVASQAADSGLATAIQETTGDVNDPTVVHDYNGREQLYLNNFVIGPAAYLKVLSQAASAVNVGGLLTSAQSNNPAVVTIQPSAAGTIPALLLRGNASNQVEVWQSKDYSESTTAGNECFVTGYGIPLCVEGSETASTTFMLAAHNIITSETGAANAIAGTLGTYGPPLQTLLDVTVVIAHTLQAGPNTFAYAGGGAVPIKSHLNPANDIGTAYAVGSPVTLRYCPSGVCAPGNVWLDVSDSVTTLIPSGVTPGTYGDSQHVPVFQVNAAGQIVLASSVALGGFTGTKTRTACATITGGVPSACSNVTETYVNGLLQ